MRTARLEGAAPPQERDGEETAAGMKFAHSADGTSNASRWPVMIRMKVSLRNAMIGGLMVLALATAPFAWTASGAQALGQNGEGADSGEFRLGASDVIHVSVWGEVELTISVIIRPDGRISLPLVGEVEAAGQTPMALGGTIEALLREFYDAPRSVVVIVEQINSSQVSVLGEVASPTRFALLEDRVTVLDAIAVAGGFTEFANRDRVIVLRTDASGTGAIEVDIKAILEGKASPFVLRPGDAVYVRE